MKKKREKATWVLYLIKHISSLLSHNQLFYFHQSPIFVQEGMIMETEPQTQAAKKSRKVDQKTVVKVKIDGNGGGKQQRGEGPPSDLWSWRKYGQKPIKGSPYPRGYYKCSSSKGCSAKKQVERCKTDASLLLVTYTSTHNHPAGGLQHTTTQPNKSIPTVPLDEQQQHERKQHEYEEEKTPPPPPPPLPASSNPAAAPSDVGNFHYLKSSSTINQDVDNPFTTTHQLDNTHELLGFVFLEEPVFYPQIMNFPAPTKLDENDFFDELEELPTSSSSSSSLNSFMRSSSILDERILLQPS